MREEEETVAATSFAGSGSRERSKTGNPRSFVKLKNSRFIILPDDSATQPLKNDLLLYYMKT